MNKRTRILIADDQELFAESLRFVIESRAPDFEVVDLARTGKEAFDKATKYRPDIILMDVRMPDMDGVEATRIIHGRFPDIKILILTTFDDDEYVLQSIKHGAIGYILKNRPPTEVIHSIYALQDGILQIDPAVSSKLIQVTSRTNEDDSEMAKRLSTLTLRELEVLRLLVLAESIWKIAQHLSIAEQTVRNHINSIYSKLSIHTRIDLVRYIDQIRLFLVHNPE